ncbi:MAG: sporulation peptidase YabG [Inconstantimicrobium porci]|uniref:Sporulation peptidase YabG n=1 Tax=Inconstantimicrobium porci TaxID=2652291 RepID=A0A7X2MXN2_9CLOT|nr:sporulation peptidase YabG [Inconstantimicrobium porci]MDD6770808.1 sporulation peptidase YabG [Inconstantimicrobium porci]MDY5911058.1 sporulation peptidase YabG [Inconstantimicrobium porci]MSR90940.1 sporulation peptidase YabG [Inconstantimicrobium porci]
MKIGDIVVRKSYGKDISFEIVDIKPGTPNTYVLKGINIRIIADANEEDLEETDDILAGKKDKIFNSRISDTIKRIIISRDDMRSSRSSRDDKELTGMRYVKTGKIEQKKELFFGRPGKILHVDADEGYLNACLKVYKELNLDAVGVLVNESKQPEKIVDIVKEVKPDIVVLTGHDGFLKSSSDYLDLNNYRNSKYFIDAVKALRNYNSSYDELVIFAGACQSCYESILDAGANFASSPNRVLIHCLDPVFVCERVAYTRIDKVVSMADVLENTITGNKGIGGLQTRGKYREGYPKSQYVE